MILEVATLDVHPSQESALEAAFGEAKTIISGMPGSISLELQRCLVQRSRYLLVVRWESVEFHTIGFRRSPEYGRWRDLLHHFYDPFPTVEHYESLRSTGLQRADISA